MSVHHSQIRFPARPHHASQALERAVVDLDEAPRTWRVVVLDSIATTMREFAALHALPSVKLAPKLLQGSRRPPKSGDGGGGEVYNANTLEDGLVGQGRATR